MQYDVVQSGSVRGLVDFVNRRIKSGWVPISGMTMQRYNLNVTPTYFQTVVKYDTVELQPNWKAYLNALVEHFENTEGFEVPTDEPV